MYFSCQITLIKYTSMWQTVELVRLGSLTTAWSEEFLIAQWESYSKSKKPGLFYLNNKKTGISRFADVLFDILSGNRLTDAVLAQSINHYYKIQDTIKKCHESREPSRPNQQPLLFLFMLLATPRFLIDFTFSRNSQSQETKPSRTA